MSSDQTAMTDEQRSAAWMAVIDPDPISYPFAPPGGLDLAHWSDYTQTQLEPGPAAGKKVDMEMESQKQARMDEQSSAAWQAAIDPNPVSYPFAPPGGLYLLHWSDYTETQLAPGSAAEAKMDNEKTTDTNRRRRGRRTPPSSTGQ